jgi:hypothetical protein
VYQNTTIIIRKDRINCNTPIEINKGAKQGCPLAPVLFNIYIDQTKYFSNGLNFKFDLIHG